MTERQIRNAIDLLPPHSERSGKQQDDYKELRCREMINSIMIYHGADAPYNEKTGEFNRYLDMYVNGYYNIGPERVRKLIEEQKADFAKAKVTENVYTDHEGCTYNTCIWGDER